MTGHKLQGAITAGIIGIIVIVVLFSAYSTIMPTAMTAGDSMNDTYRCNAAGGTMCTTNMTCMSNATAPCINNATSVSTPVTYDKVPLASLFGGGSVVFVIVMAALLIVVVMGFFHKKK